MQANEIQARDFVAACCGNKLKHSLWLNRTESNLIEFRVLTDWRQPDAFNAVVSQLCQTLGEPTSVACAWNTPTWTRHWHFGFGSLQLRQDYHKGETFITLLNGEQ